MKQKIREQISALAKQLIEEEKTFKASSMKKLVGEFYEKLTVLEYLENQIGDTYLEVQEEYLDSKSFREESWFNEPEPVPQPQHKEELIEPLMEKIKDIVAQMPEEGEQIDNLLEEMLPTTYEPESNKLKDAPSQKYTKNDLEEFASNYQKMPEFERKQMEIFPKSAGLEQAGKAPIEHRAKSLNDSVNKGLNIGLNDRLAFIKHLFDGKVEDYSRVLSQINTMGNYEEAQNFLKGQVKPDYNGWENKEEYSERFLNIIEKRFN